MNLYQKQIYSSFLEHGEHRDHKYLYKIGDRYIYPDDVKKEAGIYGNAAKNMVLDAGKAIKKKAKSMYDDRHIYGDAAKNMAQDTGKAIKDKWNNGGKEKTKKVANFMTPYPVKIANETASEVFPNLKRDWDEHNQKVRDEYNAEREKASKERDKILKEKFDELKKQEANKQKKKSKKKVKEELPEGFTRKSDGYVYDDLGAIVPEEYIEKLKKQNKDKSIAKK